MNLFMHICCGPCATYPIQTLRAAGHDIHGFFYNPNIHPLAEFRLRLEAAEKMIGRMDIPADICEDYDIEEFFRRVAYREHERCAACYHLRLERAARTALEGGFDAFTSSLLVSPYQKHELIREIGRQIGIDHKIEFFYEDFRPGWPETRAMSREMELYRQKYCGCIFSERERFASRDRKRPQPPKDASDA